MLNKVHPEDRARYRAEFVKALKGETPMEIAYRVTRARRHGAAGAIARRSVPQRSRAARSGFWV